MENVLVVLLDSKLTLQQQVVYLLLQTCVALSRPDSSSDERSLLDL